MSLQVQEDLIGGDAEESGLGFRCTRLFKVYGLTAPGDAVLFRALERSELPAIGRTHPRKPAIVCLRKRVALGGTSDAWDLVVRCEYGPPELLDAAGGGVGQVGDVTRGLRGELITEDTVRDVNGNLMQTRYISRLATGLGGSSVGISTLTHKVSVQRPTYSIVTQRIESEFPYLLARQIHGRVNAGSYRGEARDMWLLSMESDQRGDGNYDTRYSVTLSESGWQATINHNVAGAIPNDARVGNGIEVRQVYKRANFQLVPL